MFRGKPEAMKASWEQVKGSLTEYLRAREQKHTHTNAHRNRAIKKEKASSCQFFSSSFSSHLVATFDSLLVFSLLRETMGRESVLRVERCTY